MDVMQKFKNEFFEERKDLLSKNHVYRNHINKFVRYLNLPSVQLSNAPARININVVEECIKYYHNEGDLNSRSTMESHLESVKSFYDYLSETGKATDIFSSYSYSKFKDEIVEKYSLLEPVERGSYKCGDIKTILIKLDKAIDDFQDETAGVREEDNLFEYLYKYKGKFRVESLNSWFYNIAQDFGIMEEQCKDKKTLAVEPIRNMVIQMMVDNMINPVFISKIAGLTLTMIEATYYPKDWNVKCEEDINKCINKSIAQNDYYCYV